MPVEAEALLIRINAFGLFEPALQRLTNFWTDPQSSNYLARCSWREG